METVIKMTHKELREEKAFQRSVKWMDKIKEIASIKNKGGVLSKENPKLNNWYYEQRKRAKKGRIDMFHLDFAKSEGVELLPVDQEFMKNILMLQGLINSDIDMDEIDGLFEFYKNLKSNYSRDLISQPRMEFMAYANFTLRTDKDLDIIADALSMDGGVRGYAFINEYYTNGDFEYIASLDDGTELDEYLCMEDSAWDQKKVSEGIYTYRKLTKKERAKVIMKLIQKNTVNDKIHRTREELWYGICDMYCDELETDDHTPSFLMIICRRADMSDEMFETHGEIFA